MRNRLSSLLRLACITAMLALFLSPLIAAAENIPDQADPQQSTTYLTVETVTLGNGIHIEKNIISGPPKPPEGYEFERAAVTLPEPDQLMGTKTVTVPTYDWLFGCSAVCGAMIAAYYDRNGFDNMYTGPTNGGVMPLDSSTWGTWSDGTATYPNNPLVASHNGLDGRATLGSLDDYWVAYGSTANDPYITGGWTQHTWGDAIGDYMKTSQSAHSNDDGSTTFYTWLTLATPLTCDDMETNNIDTEDGTYGRKQFYEVKGYTVTDCYNQKTDNTIAGGFSFAQFKAEIDAGRPVLMNLAGHSIVGVGYDDSANTVYIHDTWDYLKHEMTWGGSYSGMNLLSVSIVNLQPTTSTTTTAPTTTTTVDTTTTTTAPATTTSIPICIDNDGDGYGINCNQGQDCNDGDAFYNELCPDCGVNIIPWAIGRFLGEKEKTRNLFVMGKKGTVFDESTPVRWESADIAVVSKRVFMKRFMFMKVSIDGAALGKGSYRGLIGACSATLNLVK
jgi:hypothetical protein